MADNMLVSSLLAGANLSSSQWTPVKLASTAGEVVQATATTDVCFGILLNDPADGEPALVCTFGECDAVSGTSAADWGTLLSANSTGVTNVNAGAGGVVGYALESTTTKGDRIRIFVRPNWNY